MCDQSSKTWIFQKLMEKIRLNYNVQSNYMANCLNLFIFYLSQLCLFESIFNLTYSLLTFNNLVNLLLLL